ncbi:glycosyltransferase family 4 protein [Desulfobacterota bacterium AH_259_B03_O07]|nr:glycosyltransferase family 4 protein [Desulfobacterota bacterium AH_259_B03_O07]
MKIKTIAVSNNLADLLTTSYKTHAQAVENGIDINSLYPDPDEVLLSSKGNNKAILLLSRKDYRKGLDIAIRVINITSSDLLRKIEIWTCGEKLENGIFNTKVRNFGWVGIDDLRKILSSADVLFYPTRHEGFGLLPLEAMACGCPVITTQAVPYVTDSENALVTEVKDIEKLKIKLREILSNKSLCDRLKQNGLITAKNYNIKESQMKFSKTLNQLLSS